MIATRKEAMFLIGMHLVPNIFGVARFSYGFHRTVSPVGGLILDVWHGGECVANICIDAGMILLLWREVVMTRLLGLFVVWNTLSMLFCCGANIAGLRYPPKWYTYKDADQLTMKEKTRLVIFWAPVIVGFAFAKLYYTSLLYEFYKIYKSTGGKAYDGQGLARIACSGRTSKARTPTVVKVEGQVPAGLSPLPQQDGAITAAETPASAGRTPSVYSQMHSATAQGGGGTAAQSAIASSVTTPRNATAPSSAVMTPKPTDGASVVPRTAAQEGVAVAVETKPKSRTTRSKKQPGTADARNAAAGKVTPKTPGDRARQL